MRERTQKRCSIKIDCYRVFQEECHCLKKNFYLSDTFDILLFTSAHVKRKPVRLTWISDLFHRWQRSSCECIKCQIPNALEREALVTCCLEALLIRHFSNDERHHWGRTGRTDVPLGCRALNLICKHIASHRIVETSDPPSEIVRRMRFISFFQNFFFKIMKNVLDSTFVRLLKFRNAQRHFAFVQR